MRLAAAVRPRRASSAYVAWPLKRTASNSRKLSGTGPAAPHRLLVRAAWCTVFRLDDAARQPWARYGWPAPLHRPHLPEPRTVLGRPLRYRTPTGDGTGDGGRTWTRRSTTGRDGARGGALGSASWPRTTNVR